MPGASKEPVQNEIEKTEASEAVVAQAGLKQQQSNGEGAPNIKSSSNSDAEAEAKQSSKDPLDTLPALRFKADVHFSLNRSDKCLELLNRIRLVEVENHGAESQQVLDTDLAICSALHAAAIPESIRLDKKLEEFIMSEEKELAALMSEVHQRCAAYEKEGGYRPGPDCAKMLVADWFNKFEKAKSSAVKKTVLKLYEEAYAARLAKFGPDALETLVAERLYYIERTEQLDEDPEDVTEGTKGELYQKLRDQLGKGHKLVKGLEVKLRLCVDDSSDNPQSHDAEVDELAARFKTAFKLSAAERFVIRPEPVLHYEQSIVATEKFFETIKKSSNELAAKLIAEQNERKSKLPDEIKALMAQVRSCEENGEFDKAMYLANKLLRIHPNAHFEDCISLGTISHKLLKSKDRFDDALWCMTKLDDILIKQRGKHDIGRNGLLLGIRLLEAHIGWQNKFKRDQERIKVARVRVETCLKTHGLEHTTTLKAKYLLAEALLTTFENDEGLSILMDIYPLQALRLGHKNPESMSTLEALLSNDFTEELTSFHVFKTAKQFFDKQCPVLSKKFPKSDRIVLKIKWFQAYVKCVVTGKMLGLDEQHPELNVMEQTLFEFVQKYPHDKDLYWMLWQVAMFFQKPHIGRHATFRIIMDNFQGYLGHLEKLPINDRLRIQIQCSLLPDLQVQGQNENAINELKQLYKLACKYLQPHDPTIWQILNTILLVFARLRSRSGPLKDDFDFFQEAYERLERFLGPLHPLTVNAFSIIPYIYGKWNLKFAGLKPNMDKIAALGHEALDRAIKVFGKDHETTIRVRRGLGGIIPQMDNGSQTEAMCQLKQAVSSSKALKGDHHYNYDSFCKDVCRGYIEMGKISEALDLVTQLFETSKRYYGPNHLSTLIAQKFVNDYKKMMTTPMVFEGEAPGGGMLFSIQL